MQTNPSEESASVVSNPKPKRGRPKGSKTKDLPKVKILPQSCPGCGGTEFKVIITIRQRDHEGSYGGQKYNRITWRREQCEKCPQVLITRTYRLI